MSQTCDLGNPSGQARIAPGGRRQLAGTVLRGEAIDCCSERCSIDFELPHQRHVTNSIVSESTSVSSMESSPPRLK